MPVCHTPRTPWGFMGVRGVPRWHLPHPNGSPRAVADGECGVPHHPQRYHRPRWTEGAMDFQGGEGAGHTVARRTGTSTAAHPHRLAQAWPSPVTFGD